ncbi:type II toxin-antitoxin system HipA family toxin [Thauera sinica]|uniref:Type II toxin-antitoxin system HipA family toxin n=1 Tax=Thauera sinica TaxID=2665146 RepID=A0ABW1AV05_9RHOO|nr:type II toxin-antitoxin system HipA family toxin [Thauera sp. K11]ATE59336.1 toxin HipA [Thauera sp. K11]
MGRRSHTRALNAWINGRLAGQWRLPARGAAEFQYDAVWTTAPEGRPLSLSLPMTPDNLPLRGEAVLNYFDNLLPDSDRIRARLQSRFRTRSRDAFDLLAAIGRDCVGAVQLLPEDTPPDNVFRIEVEPLDEAGVERMLTAAVAPHGTFGDGDDGGDFRISIAGAQEKTALTWHEGRWCRPLGATPTTHIFKLPLGLVGNRQADMRTSVENEWLCARLLAAFDVPVAPCQIQRFGEQKVLVVERFDRRLASSNDYWLRLPQEDFCQATGTPPHLKYEADGGPGLLDIARILHGSESREADLATLLKAQLLFWMLAATDGHAKNFSIFLLAGGRYRLTPLYDVLSAWPVAGSGPNHLDYHKLALRGKNAHYRLRDIQRRHFNEAARRCGLGLNMDGLVDEVIARVPAVAEQVGAALPDDFPEDVFRAVVEGLRISADRL